MLAVMLLKASALLQRNSSSLTRRFLTVVGLLALPLLACPMVVARRYNPISCFYFISLIDAGPREPQA
jgi:hypothetical protein